MSAAALVFIFLIGLRFEDLKSVGEVIRKDMDRTQLRRSEN